MLVYAQTLKLNLPISDIKEVLKNFHVLITTESHETLRDPAEIFLEADVRDKRITVAIRSECLVA